MSPSRAILYVLSVYVAAYTITLSRQNYMALLVDAGFLVCKITQCPFNKIQILCLAMMGLTESFRTMYRKIPLSFSWTLPFNPDEYPMFTILAPDPTPDGGSKVYRKQ